MSGLLVAAIGLHTSPDLLASTVVQNLMYPLGAVLVALAGGTVLTWRHRRPKSVQDHMDSFARGLDALSPGERKPVARRSTSLPGFPPAPPEAATGGAETKRQALRHVKVGTVTPTERASTNKGEDAG